MIAVAKDSDGCSAATKGERSRRATDIALQRWEVARQKLEDVPRLADLGQIREGDPQNNQFILRCDSRIDLSVFIYCGEDARSALGDANHGQTLAEAMPLEIRDKIYEACMSALQGKAPSAVEGEFENDGSTVRFRCIFMPTGTSDPEGGGHYLFGAFSSDRPLNATLH